MPSTLHHKVTLAIPHHFPVDLRSTLPYRIARAPKAGAIKPMKRIQSLLSAFALLTLGALIVGAIVFLLVDAILGGVQ